MIELHRHDDGDLMLFDDITYIPRDHYVCGSIHGCSEGVYCVKETRAEMQALLKAEWCSYQYQPDIMTRAFELATQIISDEACTGLEKLRAELLEEAAKQLAFEVILRGQKHPATPGGETDE